nr:hypothetical protein [Dolomedes mizhoanus]
MRFHVLLLLSLFIIVAAKPIDDEENRQNDGHIPWMNWMQQSGGPVAFRAERRAALMEILDGALSED